MFCNTHTHEMIYIISTKEKDVENILQTFNQERIKHKNVFSNDF